MKCVLSNTEPNFNAKIGQHFHIYLWSGPHLPYGQPDQKINVVYDFPLGDVDILVPQLCTHFLNDGPWHVHFPNKVLLYAIAYKTVDISCSFFSCLDLLRYSTNRYRYPTPGRLWIWTKGCFLYLKFGRKKAVLHLKLNKYSINFCHPAPGWSAVIFNISLTIKRDTY